MKTVALTEGIFTIDAQHQLQPYTYQNKDKQQASLVIGIHPFLIQMNTEIILLDTGLGHKNENGILTIYDNLYQNNISAFDVSMVLLSHLHHDHVKGIASYQGNTETLQLNFPNATYYVNQDDFEMTIRSEFVEREVKQKLLFLQNETSALHFFRGEKGKINNNIQFTETNAHSMHHTVFWVQDQEQMVFYGADDAPQLFQMQRKMLAKYDYDSRQSAKLREQWWQEGQQQKWVFLFYHDTHTPIYQF